MVIERKDIRAILVMETNTVTKLALIARIAEKSKTAKFTSLLYLLNANYLYECFLELKKRKAAGIDGKTVESYTELEIKRILGQTATLIQQKKYRPKPVRSVDILKDNGKIRSLGIPTVVDKVVQLAMTKILKVIYEPNFLDVSFGYRPGIDAHSCLKKVEDMIIKENVNWIIDADISGYFDNIDHAWMMRCISERISDPNFKRLIYRFLKAGVMKDNQFKESEKGTPQGGIISPVLANIYLHYVLDLWFEKQERKRINGYAQLIRYADDFIIGVQLKSDANYILEDLAERLKKFGLTLSSEKTGLKEFGRYAQENRKRKGRRKPETFDFLGFTHYCSQTRNGKFTVKQKTSKKKMKKSLAAMHQWFKRVSNQKQLKEIWPILQMKIQGHYNYYGVQGNFEGLKNYYRKIERIIFKLGNERSQKRSWNWEEFGRYLSYHPLPRPKLTYAIYQS
jgi:RNA-directed DNA polymerase